MADRLSESDLERLSAQLANLVGLHFPPARWLDLERGIRSAARDFGFRDAKSCVEWLAASPISRHQVEVLASHLTVGETYFFREKGSFEILENRILPELIRRRAEDPRALRIWSAGCASGEEPYSIAIVLDRVRGTVNANALVLATDINSRSLEKAAAGVYSDWSFRDAPVWLKETYFTKKGKYFEILRTIKKRVFFSYLNLAEDVYPSLTNSTNAMDVIFCRNVMMYFAPERAAKVVEKLYHCLVEGGWLVVSPCEASSTLFSQFVPFHFPGAILYQKNVHPPSKESDRLFVFDPAPTQSPCNAEFGALPSVKVEMGPFLYARAESEAIESSDEPPPPTAFEAARVLYEKACFARVVDILESRGDPSAETPEARALLARSYANQGHLAMALAVSDRLIGEDNLRAGNHYLRATILLEQGALEEAKLALRRTLYLDPKIPLAHLMMSNLARQLGDHKTSAKHLEVTARLLAAHARDEILPESEGITAGRLMEIVDAQRGLKSGGIRQSLAAGMGPRPAWWSSRYRKEGNR